jgi:integrase
LAICEGLRPGEITGLKRRDYYDRTLHIRQRVYRGIIDEPKGRRSRREIPATDTTVALLDRWLDLIPGRPDGWLFPSETGKTPISYSNVLQDRIKPALAAAGISTNYQILRRTWVNAFKPGEKDANVRAQLAGHSLDVHSNVYHQPQPAALKRTMRKLDKRLQ